MFFPLLLFHLFYRLGPPSPFLVATSPMFINISDHLSWEKLAGWFREGFHLVLVSTLPSLPCPPSCLPLPRVSFYRGENSRLFSSGGWGRGGITAQGWGSGTWGANSSFLLPSSSLRPGFPSALEFLLLLEVSCWLCLPTPTWRCPGFFLLLSAVPYYTSECFPRPVSVRRNMLRLFS